MQNTQRISSISREISYLSKIGLREDEIEYLIWLRKKARLTKRRKSR